MHSKKKRSSAERMSGEPAQGETLTEGQSSTEVAFFFGAGASIAAGVPDTFSFVDAFVQFLDSSDKKPLEHLIEILSLWGRKHNPPKTLDIELLLEALQRLADKEQDLLLPFFDGMKSRVPDFDATSLLKKLRDFIKSRVIVEPEAIKYLEPLRAFIQDFRPVDIYSANYDTCIELFCSEYKLDYKDGFDEAWNPKVFDDPDIDLRLFKIHGSVTWYRSNRGRYLKIPVMTQNSALQLITRERAEGLMLYPAQKFEYVEPLFELLIEMKLRLAQCTTLFVVGYSFRDDHIRRIFWDVARKNRDFYVVLVSPDARKIYEDRLKTYEGGIPSSLENRVICLPYLFEKILPVLKYDFFSDIRLSRASLGNRKRAEIAGQNIDWTVGLIQAARGGDNESLHQILEKFSQIDQKELMQRSPMIDENIFESTALGIMHTIGNGDGKMLSYFWGKFKDTTFSIIDGITIQVYPAESRINAHLKSGKYLFSDFLQRTRDLVVIRSHWMKTSESLNILVSLLDDLCVNLKPWSQGTMSFSSYQAARHPCPKELLQDFEILSGKTSSIYGGVDRGPLIIQRICEIERSKITEIFEKYEEKFTPQNTNK